MAEFLNKSIDFGSLEHSHGVNLVFRSSLVTFFKKYDSKKYGQFILIEWAWPQASGVGTHGPPKFCLKYQKQKEKRIKCGSVIADPPNLFRFQHPCRSGLLGCKQG